MSTDELSTTTSHSSSKSPNMHIDMPPSSSTQASPQNPHTTTWHAHPPHLPHLHVATPHPLASTTEFLDKHVPAFAKHHHEYTVNANFRSAKREARHSLVNSPIPENHLEDDDSVAPHLSTALHTANAATIAPAMADLNRHTLDDNEAWQAVLAKRENARHRAGTDLSNSGSDTSPLSKHSMSP
ncbi:hypothetical protein PV11_05090 [Exophiala sideris]|uniref:Uncharacterized protein n=1 Tax=Exophiala sideris TaxID=1016849 RepID=A0A0D1W2N7_9EURO|nr:hypothetical protein PV11_05090 [Exophiala sideris]